MTDSSRDVGDGAPHMSPGESRPPRVVLQAITPWAKCFACGHSQLLPLPPVPTCCTHPFVISVYVAVPSQPHQEPTP